MGFAKTEKIWFNGRLVNWDDAKVHVLAHGLHYGTGIFEGMRCYATGEGPAVFRLDAHLDRFYRSAELYELTIPYEQEALAEALRAYGIIIESARIFDHTEDRTFEVKQDLARCLVKCQKLDHKIAQLQAVIR